VGLVYIVSVDTIFKDSAHGSAKPIDGYSNWTECLYHHKISLYSGTWDHLHSLYVHIMLGLILIKLIKILVVIKISTNILSNSIP
jgi:hypothetical protein